MRMKCTRQRCHVAPTTRWTAAFQPFVRVRDHELDAAQAASDQTLQEVRPEGLGFRRANAEPDDLAPSFGVGGHSDYRGDRDDASTLAHLQVGRIQPQIWPVAFKRTFEEGLHALVDFLAQFRDLALRDAGKPHRLRDLVDPARRHPADPGLLDDGDQRLFRRLARLQEWREVAAGPQLRDLEVERAKPRVERAVAVAVAPVQPISGPFVPASADQPLDVGLHQQLQDALGHSTQKVTVAGLLQKLIQWQSVLGHRGPPVSVKSSNSTLDRLPR